MMAPKKILSPCPFHWGERNNNAPRTPFHQNRAISFQEREDGRESRPALIDKSDQLPSSSCDLLRKLIALFRELIRSSSTATVDLNIYFPNVISFRFGGISGVLRIYIIKHLSYDRSSVFQSRKVLRYALCPRGTTIGFYQQSPP